MSPDRHSSITGSFEDDPTHIYLSMGCVGVAPCCRSGAMARLPWSPPAWYLLAMHHFRLANFILFCGHDKHQAVISLLGHSYTHPLSSILSTYGTRFYATAIISAGAFRRIPLFSLESVQYYQRTEAEHGLQFCAVL